MIVLWQVFQKLCFEKKWIEFLRYDQNKASYLSLQINLILSIRNVQVQAKKEYEYRVAAVNEEGEGDKSQSSAPIPARPLKEKPKFDRLTAPKEIRIRAGEPLKIPLDIVGSPTPLVSWSKDGSRSPAT